MKDISNQASPYDNSRNGNPFYKQTTGKITVFILLILLAIAARKYVLSGSNKNNPNDLPRQVVSTLLPGTNISQTSTNSVGNISFNDSLKLDKLHAYQQDINLCWSEITKHHKVPWKSRNISGYKEALIKGITLCNELNVKLDMLEPTGEFAPLFLNEKEYVFNSGLSFKYYLDYVNTKNKSDIELGNRYLNSTNSYAKARKLSIPE